MYIGNREEETVNHTTIIENNLQFPNYKSFYNQPNFRNFWLFFCMEIAKATNHTLRPLLNNTIMGTTEVSLYPMLYSFPGSSVSKIWNSFYNHTTQHQEILPRLFHVDNLYQTFIYCRTLQPETDYFTTTILLILKPFDGVVLSLLALSLIVIALLLLSAGKLEYQTSPIDFSYICLYVWSIVLSPVLSNVNKVRRSMSKNLLVCLWLIANIIIANHYTGILTMKLTYSPPVNRIKTVEELSKENATVVYSAEYWRNADLQTSKLIHFVPMIKLLQRAVIRGDYVGSISKYDRLTFFAFRTELFRVIGQLNKKRPESKRCYAGKEWFFPTSAYFMMVGQESKRVVDILSRFASGGVLERWHTEQTAILSYDRIQDQAKERSLIKHKELSLGHQKNVKMNGQMWGVLTLYGVLGLTSSIVFVLEMFGVSLS